jgi:hypothetical protein
MSSTHRRPVILVGILALVVLLGAAVQTSKFPGGTFKANNGSNDIALTFDSTGALKVFVDNQSFSQGTWQVKADTLTFGTVTGPEGYSCNSAARYLWKFADTRLSFTLVGTDDCSTRRDPILGLTWTRG